MIVVSHCTRTHILYLNFTYWEIVKCSQFTSKIRCLRTHIHTSVNFTYWETVKYSQFTLKIRCLHTHIHTYVCTYIRVHSNCSWHDSTCVCMWPCTVYTFQGSLSTHYTSFAEVLDYQLHTYVHTCSLFVSLLITSRLLMVDLLLGTVPCFPLVPWEGGAVLLSGRGIGGGVGWMRGPVEE